MIGRSIPEYLFIRASILALRLITPLSFAYLSASAYYKIFLISPWVATYPLAEASFYLFVYLPRSWILQKDATHPPILSTRAQRGALFAKCFARVRDSDLAAGWFLSVAGSDIKRENMAEWLLWALFSTHKKHQLDEWQDELDGYIRAMETLMGHKLEDGASDIHCMKITLDPVVMLHRPLIWYCIVGIVDTYTSLFLFYNGFRHYAPRTLPAYFPLRFLTVLSRQSTHPQLGYWYRPHRSTTKHPVLFLHGIGIGLWPYLPFFKELDPDVGVIAIENLSICMRISPPPLDRDAMLAAITSVLDFHNFSKIVVAGHSYGTITAAHMMHDDRLNPRITSLLLVDPIPFLLHVPAVAYNFVYRIPRTANEWQLWYFASRDADIARALGRHFFWAENVLWKEELGGRPVGIVLSGRDQIVDSREVHSYLTGEESLPFKWEKDKLQVWYYPDLDHSNVFDTAELRRPLVEMISMFVEKDSGVE